MISDVFHCVRVTLIKVFLSNGRKLEICPKSIKEVFQNNDCTELTTDERMSLDHSRTHLTSSLDEFGSSPFQDGGNEIHFTQTQRLFSDKQNR